MELKIFLGIDPLGRGLGQPANSDDTGVDLPRELYSPMSHMIEHFAFDDVTFPLR